MNISSSFSKLEKIKQAAVFRHGVHLKGVPRVYQRAAL